MSLNDVVWRTRKSTRDDVETVLLGNVKIFPPVIVKGVTDGQGQTPLYYALYNSDTNNPVYFSKRISVASSVTTVYVEFMYILSVPSNAKLYVHVKTSNFGIRENIDANNPNQKLVQEGGNTICWQLSSGITFDLNGATEFQVSIQLEGVNGSPIDFMLTNIIVDSTDRFVYDTCQQAQRSYTLCNNGGCTVETDGSLRSCANYCLMPPQHLDVVNPVFNQWTDTVICSVLSGCGTYIQTRAGVAITQYREGSATCGNCGGITIIDFGAEYRSDCSSVCGNRNIQRNCVAASDELCAINGQNYPNGAIVTVRAESCCTGFSGNTIVRDCTSTTCAIGVKLSQKQCLSNTGCTNVNEPSKIYNLNDFITILSEDCTGSTSCIIDFQSEFKTDCPINTVCGNRNIQRRCVAASNELCAVNLVGQTYTNGAIVTVRAESCCTGFDTTILFGDCNGVCGRRPRQRRCNSNDCKSNDVDIPFNTLLDLQDDQDCCTGTLSDLIEQPCSSNTCAVGSKLFQKRCLSNTGCSNLQDNSFYPLNSLITIRNVPCTSCPDEDIVGACFLTNGNRASCNLNGQQRVMKQCGIVDGCTDNGVGYKYGAKILIRTQSCTGSCDFDEEQLNRACQPENTCNVASTRDIFRMQLGVCVRFNCEVVLRTETCYTCDDRFYSWSVFDPDQCNSNCDNNNGIIFRSRECRDSICVGILGQSVGEGLREQDSASCECTAWVDTVGSCSITCGGKGNEVVTKTCTGTYGSCFFNGKAYSKGEVATFNQECDRPTPCESEWTDWSMFGDCSETCGVKTGYKIRKRTCRKNEGCTVDDTFFEFGKEDENIELCHAGNSPRCEIGFNDWGDWSTCTETCGLGTKTRTRDCIDPQTCLGACEQTVKCNDGCRIATCPRYPECPGDCTFEGDCKSSWKQYNVDFSGVGTSGNPIYSTSLANRRLDATYNTLGCGNFLRFVGTSSNVRRSYIWGHRKYSGGLQNCVQFKISVSGEPDGNSAELQVYIYYINRPNAELIYSTISNGNYVWATVTKSVDIKVHEPYVLLFQSSRLIPGKSYADVNIDDVAVSNGYCDSAGWSHWGEWVCDVTCGSGTSKRTRECIDICPNGDDTESKSCTMPPCEVSRNGQWSQWTDFSVCSESCGAGVKTRKRDCDNPTPAYGGRMCLLLKTEFGLPIYSDKDIDCIPCNLRSCDDFWLPWTDWTECSGTCDLGTQTRKRGCQEGKRCIGECEEIEKCFSGCRSSSCPKYVSEFDCNFDDANCQNNFRQNNPGTIKHVSWFVINRDSGFSPTVRSDNTIGDCGNFMYFDSFTIPETSYIYSKVIKTTSDTTQHCLSFSYNKASPTEWIYLMGNFSVYAYYLGTSSKQIVFEHTGDTNGWQTYERNVTVEADRKLVYMFVIEREASAKGRSSMALDDIKIWQFPCNSGYSPWSEFSACSKTCGLGSYTRTRVCLLEKDDDCDAALEDVQGCELTPCPAAEWGVWKDWIGCPTNPCVGEHRCRFRYCGDVVDSSLKCLKDDGFYPLSLSCDQECEICTNEMCNEGAFFRPVRGTEECDNNNFCTVQRECVNGPCDGNIQNGEIDTTPFDCDTDIDGCIGFKTPIIKQLGCVGTCVGKITYQRQCGRVEGCLDFNMSPISYEQVEVYDVQCIDLPECSGEGKFVWVADSESACDITDGCLVDLRCAGPNACVINTTPIDVDGIQVNVDCSLNTAECGGFDRPKKEGDCTDVCTGTETYKRECKEAKCTESINNGDVETYKTINCIDQTSCATAGDFVIIQDTANCIAGVCTISIKCVLGPCTNTAGSELATNAVEAGVVCTSTNHAFCGGFADLELITDGCATTGCSGERQYEITCVQPPCLVTFGQDEVLTIKRDCNTFPVCQDKGAFTYDKGTEVCDESSNECTIDLKCIEGLCTPITGENLNTNEKIPNVNCNEVNVPAQCEGFTNLINKNGNDCTDCATTIEYERTCENDEGCRDFSNIVIPKDAKEVYNQLCSSTEKCADAGSFVFVEGSEDCKIAEGKNLCTVDLKCAKNPCESADSIVTDLPNFDCNVETIPTECGGFTNLVETGDCTLCTNELTYTRTCKKEGGCQGFSSTIPVNVDETYTVQCTTKPLCQNSGVFKFKTGTVVCGPGGCTLTVECQVGQCKIGPTTYETGATAADINCGTSTATTLECGGFTDLELASNGDGCALIGCDSTKDYELTCTAANSRGCNQPATAYNAKTTDKVPCSNYPVCQDNGKFKMVKGSECCDSTGGCVVDLECRAETCSSSGDSDISGGEKLGKQACKEANGVLPTECEGFKDVVFDGGDCSSCADGLTVSYKRICAADSCRNHENKVIEKDTEETYTSLCSLTPQCSTDDDGQFAITPGSVKCDTQPCTVSVTCKKPGSCKDAAGNTANSIDNVNCDSHPRLCGYFKVDDTADPTCSTTCKKTYSLTCIKHNTCKHPVTRTDTIALNGKYNDEVTCTGGACESVEGVIIPLEGSQVCGDDVNLDTFTCEMTYVCRYGQCSYVQDGATKTLAVNERVENINCDSTDNTETNGICGGYGNPIMYGNCQTSCLIRMGRTCVNPPCKTLNMVDHTPADSLPYNQKFFSFCPSPKSEEPLNIGECYDTDGTNERKAVCLTDNGPDTCDGHHSLALPLTCLQVSGCTYEDTLYVQFQEIKAPTTPRLTCDSCAAQTSF